MPINSESLGLQLQEYCSKYNVPLDYIFEILEDQKVTPMIRGKAMEYNAYLRLKGILPASQWDVQKLNLNAQPGSHDEDVSITHRRTGVILKVESKSAVRGKFNMGVRARILREPHFQVKCHRSRSNISLAGTSNDRYSVDSFDIIITNPSNSIYEGNTISDSLQIVSDKNIRVYLLEYYGTTNIDDLVAFTESDWRYCVPSDIAEDGFIPRTPYVKFENDSNWRSLEELETRLLQVVEARRATRNQASRRS